MESIIDILNHYTDWTVDSIAEYSKKNQVDIRQHQNLILLNYMDDVLTWNDYNRQCRGMIVDTEERKIIAYPFDKFFQLDVHVETRSVASQYDGWEVSRKYDGTMITAYKYKEEVQFATRGSFNNDHTHYCYALYQSRYPRISEVDLERYTVVFEILHTENNQIVAWNQEPELVVIGVRDLKEERMFSYDDIARFARNYSLNSIVA